MTPNAGIHLLWYIKFSRKYAKADKLALYGLAHRSGEHDDRRPGIERITTRMANKQVTYPTWGALAVLVLLLLSWIFRLHYERVSNFEHRNRFTGATCPVSEECWTRDEGKGVDGTTGTD